MKREVSRQCADTDLVMNLKVISLGNDASSLTEKSELRNHADIHNEGQIHPREHH